MITERYHTEGQIAKRLVNDSRSLGSVEEFTLDNSGVSARLRNILFAHCDHSRGHIEDGALIHAYHGPDWEVWIRPVGKSRITA